MRIALLLLLLLAGCGSASEINCGQDLKCDATLKYCSAIQGGSTTTYSCRALPDACLGANPTCDCFVLMGSCMCREDTEDQFLVVCNGS